MATDWLRHRDQLDREQERLEATLPDGFRCWLTLNAYGGPSVYGAGVVYRELTQVVGGGEGRTPSDALKKAAADWQRRFRELPRDQQLKAGDLLSRLAGKPAALPAGQLALC